MRPCDLEKDREIVFHALPAGQAERARILLETREDVLMVERGPFLEQGGGSRAYVVEDGTAVLTPIRTGVSSLNAVEILEGLQPGDRVVVSGSDQFGDAPEVRITGE